MRHRSRLCLISFNREPPRPPQPIQSLQECLTEPLECINVERSAGGNLMTKTPHEAYELIANMAMHHYSWNVARPKTVSSANTESSDSIVAIRAQISQTSINKENLERQNSNDALMRNHESAIRGLELQISGLSKVLSQREQGKLPSDTVPNPKAQVNKVSTRSGKTIDPPLPSELPKVTKTIPTEDSTEKVHQTLPETVQVPPLAHTTLNPHQPPLPYPNRLRKQILEEENGKFLKMLKQIHINIPFVDVIARMPKYAKFLKDLLTNKNKLEDILHVDINAECSVVLQNILPSKIKDLGSFTIPCFIGEMKVNNALADLGASINLMPYSFFENLNLGEPKRTNMSIQLADRSIKYPRGVVENMLVRVDKFIFPVDFVILDMEEDSNIPFILGQPFLATSQALIDVYNGKLTLRMGNDEVIFNINKTMKHNSTGDEVVCSTNSIFIPNNFKLFENLSDIGLMELYSMESNEDNLEPVEDYEDPTFSLPSNKFNISIEDPPILDLKKLPSHLEYAFLEGPSKLPVIISKNLSKDEKVELIDVLKTHKRAIAW
ncbi:putative nucleotidyltransferase, ribonuclease H [Tanacetum coccineum]